MRSRLSLCLILVLGSAALTAREYAPRVVSPNNADAYSMKTFAQFARWKDLKGDAKLWEVYNYLSDTRTGLYPMGAGAWEGKDALYEFGFIRDPVKMINVYNVGYCDMLGPTLAGVMQDMGIGPSRTINIPAWGHVAAEVFYDEKWHYADLDVRACFRRADGTLASVADSQKDAALWQHPSSPHFFPLDKPATARAAYEKSALEYRYGVNMGGHTMDYLLRRGETFTRWWKPQGDRWNHNESYHKDLRAILEREPKGPKCKHAGAVYTIHSRGNGRFLYKPNLTSATLDFDDGVYDAKNVAPAAAGLSLEKAGEGYATFEVRSPYVIVPSVGKYETTDDDKEASLVKIDADGVTLSVSLDNGLSWTDVAAANGSADLTPLVARTYGYLLRLNLKGDPGASVVRALEITTWVQCHPAALPSLRKGTNAMNFVSGDHYNQPTRVMEIRTNGSDAQDFSKYLVEPPKDFDPNRKLARLKGACIAKVQPPPNTRIAWFSAGGNFNAHQGNAAPKTNNSMAFAANEPKDFKTFYKAQVPAGQSHWHYNADVEVKLDEPARALFVQYIGDPGVNNLRIYAHCLDDKPFTSSGVKITHGWSENGEAKSKTVSLAKSGPYEIECAADPIDDFIEITVPSENKK